MKLGFRLNNDAIIEGEHDITTTAFEGIFVELTPEEVRNIAELAKLDLTADEVALYAGQLSDILGHFERLQELDTSHIAPTASVLPLKNVLRADVAAAPLSPAVAHTPSPLAHITCD